MRLTIIPMIVFFLGLIGCEETILHDLKEATANQVVLTLHSSGVEASKQREDEGWSVKVPSSEVSRALKSLDRTRTLRRINWKPKKIEPSFLVGREERRALLEELRSEKIEDSIKSYPGVIEAYVHLYFQERGSTLFQSNLGTDTASVLIISDRPESIDPLQIKKLIAGASGISFDSVEVIVQKLFVDNKESFPSGEDDYLARPDLKIVLNSRIKLVLASLVGGLLLALLAGLSKGRETGRDSSKSFDSTESGEAKEKLEPWELLVNTEKNDERSIS